MSPTFLGSTVRNSSKLMTDGHHVSPSNFLGLMFLFFFFSGGWVYLSISYIDDSLFQHVQRSNLLKSILWKCLLKACWKHHFQGLTQTQLAFSVACACCRERSYVPFLFLENKKKHRYIYDIYCIVYIYIHIIYIYIYIWVSPKIGYPKSSGLLSCSET